MRLPDKKNNQVTLSLSLRYYEILTFYCGVLGSLLDSRVEAMGSSPRHQLIQCPHNRVLDSISIKSLNWAPLMIFNSFFPLQYN